MADEIALMGNVLKNDQGRYTLELDTMAKAALIEWLRRFKKECPVTIRIRQGKESKTVAQLRKVHAMFRDIAVETGNDPDIVKFELKKKYLTRQREVVNMETGEVAFIDYVPSLADLERQEMADFIEHIHVFAGEFLGMTLDRSAA